nr:RNA-directed DNA polymerase, eukaryota [Tanacetum cinerariifolium]
MSKLDRFLMLEGLLGVNPNFSALTLDRYLLDHRPIMLRDSSHDYGPIPFRMYHYWFEIDGFEEMISKAWCECPIVEVNPMLYLMYKMKFLKKFIREWNGKRQSNKCKKRAFKKDLRGFSTQFQQARRIRPVINIDFPCTISELKKINWKEIFHTKRLSGRCGIVGLINLRDRMELLSVSLEDIGL